jgi:hypothetical protein
MQDSINKKSAFCIFKAPITETIINWIRFHYLSTVFSAKKLIYESLNVNYNIYN